ncbi:hypothetical protein [Rhodovulum visakhapatnamense]|uniref:hypothetical protein n=1 Tax=Rhodovulum visakhapatnamense TaxID=364297 RepID=UPI00106538BA|nr:hypothetical protein [Rhodovulum visakhapatnamense]
MGDAEPVVRAVIDRECLPKMFPTHRHDPEFWEHLGRAIASFGFLEDTLRKAFFSFTGTTPVAPEDTARAVEQWGKRLERVMTMQLWNLANEFEAAATANPSNSTENICDLVADIKKASELRNILCHGSWMLPDNEGKSLPRFSKKDRASGEIVQFADKIGIEYLSQVQAHVADLICSVVDTVTHMGYQFPGVAGPGKPIWQSDKR